MGDESTELPLPQQVFLYVEEDSDGSNYLLAYRSVAEIPADEDGILVGVYALQDRGRLITNRRLDVRT